MNLNDIDPSFAELFKQVRANTEAELKAQAALPSKYTRASGMTDPELDLSPLKYEPEPPSKDSSSSD